jgi:hypothetical protein
MKKLFQLMLAGLFALALAVGCGDEGGAEEPESDFSAGSEDFGDDDLGTEGDDLGGEPFGDEGGDDDLGDEGMDDF